MQSHYAAQFDREHSCTEAEWMGWLPGASGEHALAIDGAHRSATVHIDAGRLTLQWLPLAPRRIALLNLPRMAVRYRFEGVDEAARAAFMRHFDRYTQRGGG